MRAATPATVLVLVATVLLIFVTCTTPIIKSISFLDATIGGSGNESGQVAKLGCLGYCIGDTCAGPTIGYSFDPNQLLGINDPSAYGYTLQTEKYTTALIHGLTYALVLNPVALVACAITLLTGILAHCGDWSLICINSFFSGLASFVTFIAAGINFALFIIAKKRINAVSGAKAELGVGLWLSLAAWILIVLSSCAFCCGCGRRGGSDRKRSRKQRTEDDEDTWKAPSGRGQDSYGQQMRMDALNAESERKRNRDVPKFAVYETEHVEELPLTNDYDGVHGYQNGSYTPASYAYANQQSPYGTPGAEHAMYAAGAAGSTRGVAPATTYRDVDSGFAGFAAHNVVSPGAESAPQHQQYDQYGYQDHQYNQDPALQHMPTAGSQDYFAHAQQYSRALEQQHGQSYQGYGASEYGANTHQQQSSGSYGTEQPTHAQQQASSYSAGAASQVRSPEMESDGFGGMKPVASSSSPYDAVEQATAAGRARRLPEGLGQTQQSNEIPYTPSSSTVNRQMLPTDGGREGTDGFGYNAQRNQDPNSLRAPAYAEHDSGANSYGEAYSGVASVNDSHSHLGGANYGNTQQYNSNGYPNEKR